MREVKRRTAARVLIYQVHVAGSHGPDSTFSTRPVAEEEADRLRRSGLVVVVHAVHTPLPSDPWLCAPTREPRRHRPPWGGLHEG